MRTFSFLAALSLLLLSLAFAREAPPAPDVAYTPVSEKVSLNFKLNRVSSDGAELSLDDRRVRGPLFIQFGVSTKNGGSVLLRGMGNKSQGGGAAARGESLPDWPFLKDERGRPVLDFAFEQQIAEDPDGNPAMRMSYVGADVPLIRSMTVERPTTVPPFVSERFGVDGPIQFQKGTYTLDRRINGFWIPVKILKK